MVNQRLQLNVAVNRKSECKVGRILMEVGFGLDPVPIDFNDPNDLVVRSVVWSVVVEEVEVRSTRTP